MIKSKRHSCKICIKLKSKNLMDDKKKNVDREKYENLKMFSIHLYYWVLGFLWGRKSRKKYFGWN